jgi:hypothetical protein
MKKTTIFRDFSEFWRFAKPMTQHQIDIIFRSLPTNQQKSIKESYKNGGWDDLMKRNQIDRIVDEIKNDENLKMDIVNIRCKILKGKTVYVLKIEWDYISSLFSEFSEKHLYHLFGGIEAEQVDEQTLLLKKI